MKKECKILSKSSIYYIYILFIALMYFTQMGSLSVTKPVPGMEKRAYGYKIVMNEQAMVESMTDTLVREFRQNKYATDPIGFYRGVKLNAENQGKVKNILQMTVHYDIEVGFERQLGEMYGNKLVINKDLQFEVFKENMIKIDKLLGGNSSYSAKKFLLGTFVPQTYEEALEEYNSITQKDQVTRAVARVFGDYLSISLAILPAFVVIWRLLLDKRNKTVDVIASKGISSFILVTARFISFVMMMLIPIVLISYIPLTQGIYSAHVAGVNPDLLAFLKVIFGWLLPTMLFVIALSYFLVEFFNNYIPVLIHIGVWFVAIRSSSNNLVGNASMHLIPRFNSSGSYEAFQMLYSELILNRIVYTLLSVIILIMTIWLHSLRRKGRVIIGA